MFSERHGYCSGTYTLFGGAIDAACSTYQDVRPAAPQGGQRQPDGLAVPAVSVRLVRDELMVGKAQRRASGISSLGGVR